MTEYLPRTYTDFRSDYPEVAAALDAVGSAADGAGPLDQRSLRLAKLGIAVGAMAEGAVRSNVRKALRAGASADEIRQVGVSAITTVGFPAAIAVSSLSRIPRSTRPHGEAVAACSTRYDNTSITSTMPSITQR